MAKNSLYIIVAVVVIIIVVGGVLAYVFTMGGGGTSGNTINIYAAEYKFGTSAGNLNNPTLTLNSGQTYSVTLHNVGTTSHNWAIVMTKADGSTDVAFSGAQIASSSSPVSPGSTGSTTFTAGSAGTYYYICQVDGHVSLGMWGTVIVR